MAVICALIAFTDSRMGAGGGVVIFFTNIITGIIQATIVSLGAFFFEVGDFFLVFFITFSVSFIPISDYRRPYGDFRQFNQNGLRLAWICGDSSLHWIIVSHRRSYCFWLSRTIYRTDDRIHQLWGLAHYY